MNDLFEIAYLLVRCSGVPFSRISSVLGFDEPERFSQWFEGRSGHHPEAAGGETKQETASDGPDEALLLHVRRVFAAVLERQDTARAIRALRSRKPVRLEP